MVTTLTIDRAAWLRGEGGILSFLLRPSDGKMCCLGFYAEACGMADKDLNGVKILPFSMTKEFPVKDASVIVDALYAANDDDSPQREERITSLFAKLRVVVRFTGGEE